MPSSTTDPAPRTSVKRTLIGGIGALILLCVVVIASILIGSNVMHPAQVISLVFHPDASFESTVIHGQRIPRTLLVLVVGAALGVAGALIQSLTRNPLADSGVLGINAGASLAVVLAVMIVGVASIWFYLWFAFAGAALAAIAVYVLGGAGRTTPSPERLALAGVAISMAISAIVQAVITSNQNVFNEFRFWSAGSAEGRGYDVLSAVAPFILCGLILALCTAPALNALALGLDTARALGVRVNLTRTLVVLAVTLLAGAATAAIGPIMFIGLAVPYIVRAITGPDQRRVLPLCILFGPSAMLIADIVARVVLIPSEVQVGIMTAILGGPVFIALVRRRRLEAL